MRGASDKFRLPDSIIPTHYALTLKTDLEASTFEGHVIIDVESKETTSTIVLHAQAPLKLSRAVLTSSALKTSTRHEATSIEMDEKLERATIKFEDAGALAKGQKAKLAIAFTALLDGSMMGYYKSIYEVQGKTTYYTLTQFEATAARKAFPCWDEPAIKATFDVTLVSRKGLVSLSNMPIKESFESDGSLVFPLSDQGLNTADKGPARNGEWTVSHYETTPKMSVYLVAYAVGPFEELKASFVSPMTGRKVPVSVYATPDIIKQAQYALDVTTQVVPVYEKIFDIPYPLPKLDTLIASDFDSGAMENWGLITGRTSVYLYDEKKSGIAAKKRTATVQSHEVAHQWFGNIVTMEWWDNLWLNEAFATLMGEVIVTHEIYPEWQVHSSFINTHLKRALSLDALRSSHPIEMPCPDSSMINQIFDAISYSKGASVLKMLANMIGEKTFLKGVSIYLKRHLYGNSRTKDLWAGISEASGLDVAKIMANWTLKVGFPVVTVEESGDGLKIRQNRFLSTADVKPDEDDILWYIPLELKTVGEDGKAIIDHQAVLDEKREITIPFKNAEDRVYKLNAETAGVYRVRYSPERLAQLGEEAARSNSAFTLNDRVGLVQDAHILAKAGYGETSGSLNLLSKLKGETENLVWSEIDAAMGDLSSVWWEQSERIRDGINLLRRDLFRPVLQRLGFDPKANESADDAELRRTAVSSLVGSEDPETIQEIQRRFGLYLSQNDDSLIPGDLKQAFYISAVNFGGEKEYEKVLSVYEKPPDPSAKIAAMLALCYGSTPELRQRTEDMLLSSKVKEQDIMYFFAGSASNRKARRQIWAYTQKNFSEMQKRFKGTFTVARIVQYSIDSLTTLEDVHGVEAFFKDKDTTMFDQSLQQALDAIRSRAGWLGRASDDVETWLRSNRYLERGRASSSL